MSWRLIHIAACIRIYFFLRSNSISLFIHTMFCSSVHPSVDAQVASTFGYRWIMLLEYGHTKIYLSSWFPFFWVHTHVKLLGHVVILFWFLCVCMEPWYWFLWWLHHFTSPLTVHSGFHFSISLSTLVSFSAVLTVSILMGVMWYLVVALIGISLMISGAEHLLVCLLFTCISFLEKYWFMSLTHFFVRLFAIFVEL